MRFLQCEGSLGLATEMFYVAFGFSCQLLAA